MFRTFESNSTYDISNYFSVLGRFEHCVPMSRAACCCAERVRRWDNTPEWRWLGKDGGPFQFHSTWAHFYIDIIDDTFSSHPHNLANI